MTDIENTIAENIQKALGEIPHPALPKGTNIYGSTKIFPDYKAQDGESYFTLVHGIAHESSVSFVAVLQATRALRKGFESAIYFYGPGASTALRRVGFRPPETTVSRASRTSTTHSRHSSPKVGPSSRAASASRCTADGKRT